MRLLKATIWLICLLCAIAFFILALNGIQGIDFNGMTSIKAIPNFIVIGVCIVALIISWFVRPDFKKISPFFILGVAFIYILVATVLMRDSRVTGDYTFRVKIVDSQGNPISGITLDSLRQKRLDFINIFLPEDVRTTVITNDSGEASIPANRFQRIGFLINMEFDSGGNRVNKDYRYATFSLEPRPNTRAVSFISWSKIGEIDNSNMHSYTTKLFDPTTKEFTVFLPCDKGKDTFNYSALE